MRRVTALLTILFILLLLAGCHAAGDGPLPTPVPSVSPQVTVPPSATPAPTPPLPSPPIRCSVGGGGAPRRPRP